MKKVEKTKLLTIIHYPVLLIFSNFVDEFLKDE